MTASAAPAAPVAPVAPAAPAAPAAPQGPQPFDFTTAGLQPEHLQHVQTKGYKTVADVVAAHRAAEGLLGVPAEHIIRLPKEDKPEAWAPIYDRLGRPKTADEYKLPVPEGDDGAFAKTAGTWLHEAGLSTKQAQAIATKWNEFQAAQKAAFAAKTQEIEAVQRTALKQKWGVDFDKNYAVAENAVKAFGMTPEQLQGIQQAMGPGPGLEFLYNIGSKLGAEPGFVQGTGQPGFGAMTAADAQGKIDAVLRGKNPEFAAKLAKNDADTMEQWRRWHRVAHPQASIQPSLLRAETTPRAA